MAHRLRIRQLRNDTSRAGLLRARRYRRRYRRRDRASALADCVAAETARSLDAPLATSGPHLLDTCAAEGVAAVVLPDARGELGGVEPG